MKHQQIREADLIYAPRGRRHCITKTGAGLYHLEVLAKSGRVMFAESYANETTALQVAKSWHC